MTEQKPEAVWVFPEKKRNGGRIALIIALVVVVLLIAAGLAFFLVPHREAPIVAPSPTTSTAAPSPSPTGPSAPTDSPVPTTPVSTPPPPPDPSLPAFRDQVGFRLDTATQGLDMVAGGASDSVQTISKLQGDVQRLSDTPPPASIADEWRSELQTYAAKLDALAANPSDTDSLAGARDAVAALKRLIGA
ncbi:hypothetical protein [Microbacterium sp. 22242]|uniref:hypothetical protein n=1 Tax=Microbacterium sp. 22242 TaxID=3453896 RepID=UPI003F865A6E